MFRLKTATHKYKITTNGIITFTINWHCVPFPAPGPPSTKTTLGSVLILAEKQVYFCSKQKQWAVIRFDERTKVIQYSHTNQPLPMTVYKMCDARWTINIQIVNVEILQTRRIKFRPHLCLYSRLTAEMLQIISCSDEEVATAKKVVEPNCCHWLIRHLFDATEDCSIKGSSGHSELLGKSSSSSSSFIVRFPCYAQVGRFPPIKLLQFVLSNAHSFFSPRD